MARLAFICGTCRQIVPKGQRCPRCTPTEAERNERQPYRKGYTTAAYKAAKAKRYELAGGRCEWCGVGLTRGWHAHHVRSLRDGGDDHVDNLRALCRGCHEEIHRRR